MSVHFYDVLSNSYMSVHMYEVFWLAKVVIKCERDYKHVIHTYEFTGGKIEELSPNSWNCYFNSFSELWFIQRKNFFTSFLLKQNACFFVHFAFDAVKTVEKKSSRCENKVKSFDKLGPKKFKNRGNVFLQQYLTKCAWKSYSLKSKELQETDSLGEEFLSD